MYGRYPRTHLFNWCENYRPDYLDEIVTPEEEITCEECLRIIEEAESAE